MPSTFAKDSIEHLQVNKSVMSYMLINSTKEMNATNQKPNAKIDALQYQNYILLKRLEKIVC